MRHRRKRRQEKKAGPTIHRGYVHSPAPVDDVVKPKPSPTPPDLHDGTRLPHIDVDVPMPPVKPPKKSEPVTDAVKLVLQTLLQKGGDEIRILAGRMIDVEGDVGVLIGGRDNYPEITVRYKDGDPVTVILLPGNMTVPDDAMLKGLTRGSATGGIIGSATGGIIGSLYGAIPVRVDESLPDDQVHLGKTAQDVHGVRAMVKKGGGTVMREEAIEEIRKKAAKKLREKAG